MDQAENIPRGEAGVSQWLGFFFDLFYLDYAHRLQLT